MKQKYGWLMIALCVLIMTAVPVMAQDDTYTDGTTDSGCGSLACCAGLGFLLVLPIILWAVGLIWVFMDGKKRELGNNKLMWYVCMIFGLLGAIIWIFMRKKYPMKGQATTQQYGQVPPPPQQGAYPPPPQYGQVPPPPSGQVPPPPGAYPPPPPPPQ